MYSIGIDLGGTKVSAGLVDEKGKIQEFLKVSLELHQFRSTAAKKKRIQQVLVQSVKSLMENSPSKKTGVCGIGLISAGPLNAQSGELIHPANLKGLNRYPILKEFRKSLSQQSYSLPVYFQNDAMGAAYGEKWVGGAKKCSTFAVITVGTGIGTGVILNHQPCQSLGMGSEFGHLMVAIDRVGVAGQTASLQKLVRGTVEGLASGTGIFNRARNELGLQAENLEEMIELYEPKLEPLFKEASQALAALFYNLSLGFNLEKILISGGMVKAQRKFLPEAIKIYQGWIRARNPKFECPVSVAKLADRSGVLGAAYLPWLESKRLSF